MAGGKQTPRQQMIGMMYLVLLAMLAMNASKDLLNAFIFLEDGINVTTSNFSNTNQTIYDKISTAAASGSQTAIKTNKNANLIAQSANKLFSEIEQYKTDIIEIGGGLDEENGVPIGKDNQDIGAEYLVVKGHGNTLKQNIGKYKADLVALVDPQDTAVVNGINKLLETPPHVDYENVESPWENGISEYLPLAAVTANLTNLQSYIRNAESQVLNYLYEEISADVVKVNKISATSVAQSGYILQGDEYTANIFLAASDTTAEPIITVGEFDTSYFRKTGQINFIGDTKDLPVSGGIGKYKIKAEETGNHAWGGIMKIPHPNQKRKGEFLTYPFVNNFTVAAPSAVISSDQLNLMYMGLENEISVSAPGMRSEDLVVTASNGCRVSSKGNGKYVFVPSKGGRINITVAAKINGESKVISQQTWKSTSLPKPFIVTPGVRHSRASANALATVLKNVGSQPKYDKAFPISSTPRIVEATLTYKKGNELSSPIKLRRGKIDQSTYDQIKRLRKGNSIEIVMKAKGADNIPHKITQTVVIK